MAKSHKKKVVLILGGILLLALFFGYRYINQEHRDISTEKAVFEVGAQQLSNDFKNNEEEATKKYLNKTLQVKGQITTVEANSGSLDNAVFFILGHKETVVQKSLKGKVVTIKGRCIGYDNLLEEVKLDQTTIIE